MPSFQERLFLQVQATPGRNDRELTDILCGDASHSSQVNQTARKLEEQNRIIRRRRLDQTVGNYPAKGSDIPTIPTIPPILETPERLSEDEIKQVLNLWLQSNGWITQVAWGRLPGIDIEASRNNERWLIEVKGLGSRPSMRVNYFLGLLGETLQRMDDSNAKYSIAMPDNKQFHGLWSRLPQLAKSRTTIAALFVSADGTITEG